MAHSDARFGYQAKLGRQDHDLSQPFSFTSAPGMLLPVWYDFASPGDYYQIKHDLPVLRSIQLLAPMMSRVKVHYETFFVPIQMLYEPAENALLSLKNQRSSLYNIDNFINNNFPLLFYNEFINNLKLDDQNLVHRFDAFRLANMLGLSPQNFVDDGSSFSAQRYAPSFFPWQLLAYHTIFQYYYRLDDKTQFSNMNCNWDRFYSARSVIPDVDFMDIHQRPWDFDYFTSMYRSPLVSDVNMQRIMPSGIYNPLTTSNQSPLTRVETDAAHNDITTSFGNPVGISSNADLNTAAIRQLFANEKLAMITGRARKNYDAQVLAHYGQKVPHDVKHDITMVHHDIYDLNVMEVTSLASTSDAPLGELAGKSFAGGNRKEFNFTAPCHGVLMTIFSVEPIRSYLTGFDRINAITNAFDFPVPEYDRLGNVPMYNYEGQVSSELVVTGIAGWKERYYQFKRKMPKVTFAFFNESGLNNYAAYMVSSAPFGKPGGLPATVPSDSELSRPDLEDRFYIDRNCLDGQCALNYLNIWQDGNLETPEHEDWGLTPWLAFARDPFIVDSFVKCTKVSWMSKDGEPIYD